MFSQVKESVAQTEFWENANFSYTNDDGVKTTVVPNLNSQAEGEYQYYNPVWFLDLLDYQIFKVVFISILPFLVSLFGIASNTLSIIVFYRQGPLGDSCTASLVCLSVSDLIISLIKSVASVLLLPCVLLPVMGRDVNQAVVNMDAFGALFNTHVIFLTSMTSWITVYIAMERMLSVTMPFHVKRIFTAKRTYAAIVVVFVISFILQAPKTFYYTIVLPDRGSNSSSPVNYRVIKVSGLIGFDLSGLCAFVNDFVLRIVCLCAIVAFNSILIVKVNLSSRFRKSISTKTSSSTNAGNGIKADAERKIQNSSTSTKEMVLTKMIIVLCAMFLVCYFPVTMMFMSMWFDTGLSNPVIYAFDVVGIFTESVNSSSSFNIFIYGTMSSRFNKELRRLLNGRCK